MYVTVILMLYLQHDKQWIIVCKQHNCLYYAEHIVNTICDSKLFKSATKIYLQSSLNCIELLS